MAGPRKVYSKSTLIADAVGISHFIVANVFLVIGEFTSLFQHLSDKYSGLAFVYQYLDRPVFALLSPVIGTLRYDTFQALLVGELIIIASSIVYGLIAFCLCKLIAHFNV